MLNSFITILAISLDICIESKNYILKELLFDYAKEILNKKQIIYLYIKIASIKRDTSTYLLIESWIRRHNGEIIKHFLYK